MNKLELVHLHGLLACVAEDCVDRSELTVDDLAEYEELGISPVSIQESRGRHMDAVQTLASTIVDAVDADATVADDTGAESDADEVELLA